MKTKYNKIKSWLGRSGRVLPSRNTGRCDVPLQNSELVIRHFPIALGHAVQNSRK